MEDWFINNNIGGLGLRKVREGHEIFRAKSANKRQIYKIRMKAAAATSAEDKERYLKYAYRLGEAYKDIVAESQEKDFK